MDINFDDDQGEDLLQGDGDLAFDNNDLLGGGEGDDFNDNEIQV